MSKICKSCKRDLPLDSFSRYRVRLKDGLRSICRGCHRAQKRDYRMADPARAAAARVKLKAANPGVYRAMYLRHCAKEPVKTTARAAVKAAVRSGRLIRLPCEVCASDKAQAHHDDYSKPLDVRWLCFVHHREHHGQHPEIPC